MNTPTRTSGFGCRTAAEAGSSESSPARTFTTATERCISQLDSCELALCINRIFVLIAEFQQLCRLDGDSRWQLFALAAALQNARKLLPLAASLQSLGTTIEEDWRTCVRDLDALHKAMQANQFVPQWERQHAMDGLIALVISIQCVPATTASLPCRRGSPREKAARFLPRADHTH